MKICLYGASSDSLDKEYYQAAERLGVCIAKGGHTLVFGGGAHGIMGAVSRGAASLGGEIIGIAPKFFDQAGIITSACTRIIWTDTINRRKEKMEDEAEAFIVAPGGIGTFEEFFEVLTLKQLGRTDKPIVLLNIRGYFAPLLAALEYTEREGFMDKGGLELFAVRDTGEEALAYLMTAERISGTGYNLDGQTI